MGLLASASVTNPQKLPLMLQCKCCAVLEAGLMHIIARWSAACFMPFEDPLQIVHCPLAGPCRRTLRKASYTHQGPESMRQHTS
jgi:hypothetical protein